MQGSGPNGQFHIQMLGVCSDVFWQLASGTASRLGRQLP